MSLTPQYVLKLNKCINVSLTRALLRVRFYSSTISDQQEEKVDDLPDGATIPLHPTRGSGKKTIDEATRMWRATNTPDDESIQKLFKKDLKKNSSLQKLTASQNILKQANRLTGEDDEDEDDEENAIHNLTAPPDSEEQRKEFINPYNAKTGEYNGPKGKEPTRYGDWERGGRIYDF